MAGQPIVEGLFDPQEHHLIVTRCQECGSQAFPPRRRCAACGSTELSREESSNAGVIYSWTVIRELGGYRAEFRPYVVAQVDLDSGIRVQGMVNADPCDLSVGQRVQLDTMPVPGSEFEPDTVTYCFVPAKEAGE